MTARYLLCPGMVQSRADGDLHYVGARDLAALYGVPSSECLVAVRPKSGIHQPTRRAYYDLMARAVSGELIALHPRYDGDYRLPEACL